MFKPNEIETMPVILEWYFKDLENRIMEDIVRRIRINSEITSTADLQIQRLSEMGASKKAVRDYIQQALQLSEQGIDDLYSGAIRKGYNADKDLYTATGRDFIPYAENQQLQQLVEAVKKQTNSDIKNITQSMGFAVRQSDGKLTFQPIADYYQKTLDKAVLDITSGSFDYNTVLKRTVQEMTDSGLRWIDYASGHHNRVPVAVRRAVMTGVNQVTAKITEQNMELLQTEYVEVSWHRGARPSHQVWQGKIYHWKEKAISRQTEMTLPTSPKNPPVNQESNLISSYEKDTICDISSGIIVKTKYFDEELKYYDITDERISKIKDIQISGLSEENTKKLIQGCKELLAYMKNEPLGREGVIMYDMDMNQIEKYMDKEVRMSAYLKKVEQPCIVIHNHPDGLIFSELDIKRFAERDEMRIFGAIGHNGNIFFISKNDDYDDYEFTEYMNEIRMKYLIKMPPEEHIKFIEEVLKNASEYGVEFFKKQE